MAITNFTYSRIEDMDRLTDYSYYYYYENSMGMRFDIWGNRVDLFGNVLGEGGKIILQPTLKDLSSSHPPKGIRHGYAERLEELSGAKKNQDLKREEKMRRTANKVMMRTFSRGGVIATPTSPGFMGESFRVPPSAVIVNFRTPLVDKLLFTRSDNNSPVVCLFII
jgi:hypothetical protein